MLTVAPTEAHRLPVCAPRRSGLSRLQLALMGQGMCRTFRLRPQREDRLDRRAVEALMQPGHGR